MFRKINRGECLKKYKAFPIRGYDNLKEEPAFYYPKTFRNYILTLESKTFKGHAVRSGIEFTNLITELGIDSLIFLGDTETAWLYQQNDHPAVKKAEVYLKNKKIGKKFNGALQVDKIELPVFIKHLAWLVRCNGSLPYFYFTDSGQNILGNICQYGNMHLDILNEKTNRLLKTAVTKTEFEYMKGIQCYNKFGKTSAISGRKIIV